MAEQEAAARAVLVVGGTSGIGLATARRLAAEGARVAVAARAADRVDAVARELVDLGATDAVGLVTDLAEPGSAAGAVDATLARFGRVDVVITSAQVMAYGTVEQVDAEAFDRVTRVAVQGTFELARAALPALRRSGGGSLVVVSSLLAEIAVPSMSTYCTAKWGQLGLVRSLQAETRRERDLHVTLVLPGAIDTPIYEQGGTWAGRRGHAPPPVVAPDAVARACVRALDRPRRMVHVGPANRLAVAGFRLLPGVYDVLAPVLVDRVVLRGPRVPDDPGNVLAPRADREGERGGWRWWGVRRRR
ncbi:SDR family NAD(P)-dependent oxidoreductase [Nocardioides sp. J2M5]|uniref:SDR family NAD(P)-dependent oxidoreductase n=1 Tax=Nocardioides palaemonis TaxID=2829810 RepID=UPI001BA68C68|nr:SDR family NAD(P)-dependent oxidoreductase [Nocardioides palaemonis]MBS2938375.1 SDR family NAD(P)-dependent oxidoreductase [Nocardioides palaemonis]